MPDQINLGAALDAIVAEIGVKFPTFKTVAAEDERRKSLKVPAILVQLSELEPIPEKDPGTGQFPCLVHVEARVIMGHRTPKVRREVIQAAGAIGAAVHNRRFGIPWGAATLVAVEPDDFAPAADQYDIWRLEWVHQVDLGPSLIIDEGITPELVLYSWDPEIGPPHEGDYIPLEDE